MASEENTNVESNVANDTTDNKKPTENVVIQVSKTEFEKTLNKDQQMEIVFERLNYSIQIKETVKSTDSNRTLFSKNKTIFKERSILKEVTGIFRPGKLTAVMGASGAGKSSLLNLLSGEVSQGKVSGRILVNGKPIFGHSIKKISGFVFQDDVILATMTVREAITMSARLRLPKTVSEEDKLNRVNSIIRTLNLDKCADTLVGDSQIKGISGGERKRCAIAMELVTDPAILFLDEPTSGLDSFTAYSVVKNLRHLSQSGRSVVATIHQPSSEIFHLFDDLLLLAEGRVLYHGPILGAVPYFAKQGFNCPQFTNPSDYIFMSVLNNDDTLTANPYASDRNETNSERIERLLKVWEDSPEYAKVLQEVANHSTTGIVQSVMKQRAPFATQFGFLFNRASKNAFRNPLMVRARLAQSIFLGLFIGLTFLNVDDKTGQPANQDRAGCLFFLVVNQIFGSAIGLLSIFSNEKLVFAREFGAGYYTLPSYFLSKVLVEVPFQVVYPIIMSVLIYFLVGFQLVASKFFILVGIVVLASICGFALGICFACLFPSLPIALTVTPLLLLPLMLFSGLFINQGSIPVFLDWIKYISPMTYGFRALIQNEYTGLTIYLDAERTKPVAGETIIAQLGVADENLGIGACAAVLFAMVCFLMSLAYLALYRLVRKKSATAKFETIKDTTSNDAKVTPMAQVKN